MGGCCQGTVISVRTREEEGENVEELPFKTHGNDSINSIARRFGYDAQALLARNADAVEGLSLDIKLKEGTVIICPSSAMSKDALFAATKNSTSNIQR